MKILIVDDNEDARTILRTTLRHSGYDVEEAADGKEALEKTTRMPPDMLISDILMPVMDGFQLCREIKGDENLRKIPFVFYTATYVDEKDEELAMKVGADRFLRKPMEPNEFILMIRGLVEEVERGGLESRDLSLEEEKETFKLYSERLIKKLEKKMLELEKEIEERKEIEEALRESEDRYHSLFENSMDAVLLTALDGSVFHANKAACQMLSRSEEEICAAGRKGVVDLSDPRVAPALEQRARTGKFKGALTLLRQDGSKFQGEVSTSVFTDQKGHHRSSMIIRDVTERKKAEAALQASEQRHRMMIEHMNSGVAVYETKDNGASFVFKDFNPAAERISKIKKEEIIGRELLELFPKMDRFGLVDALRRVWKTGKAERLHADYYRDDRRQGWRDNRIYKLPSGEVVALYDDVTEQKEAELKLAKSEKRLRTVLETVALLAIMLDTKGRLTFCNDFFLGLTGWKREAVLGKDWFDTFIPAEIKEVLKKSVFLKTIETGEFPAHYENEIITSSGERRLIAWNNTAFFDDKGEILEITSIGEDITDRRKSEEALRKSEAKYRDLVENINEIIYAMDVEGTLTYISPRVEKLLGYTPGEMIGKSVLEFLHEDHGKDLGNRLKEILSSGRSKPNEYRLVSKTGEIVWIRTSSRPIYQNGEISGAQGAFTDITETKKLETQLRQAQKTEAIGTLTGGIAHDYNNLLSVILGNISLAKEEMKSDPLTLEFLREAEQATLRTRDLTHRLMTLSKGGAPMRKPGSIKGLLEQSVRQTLEGSKVDGNLSIPENLDPVNHDARQIGYAIQNVLTNAMEAMPRGGTLTVKAENMTIGAADKDPALPLNEGRYVRVSIQDEGEGIPEEIMDRIFDPYFSTKEQGTQKGMGLGLATAYAIVRNHGGHITVHSAPGKGTTVSMVLPAECAQRGVQSAERDNAVTQSSIDNHQSSIRTVLVMDDEESLRNLAQRMLERLGYEVETVKDGVEAIETYKKRMDSGELFDAIILDLTIKGGMGGDQAIKELIKIDPDVKAIVSSGYFNDPVMTNFEAYGFQGAVPKPYQMADLERVLRKVLGMEQVKGS